MQKLAAGHTHT